MHTAIFDKNITCISKRWSKLAAAISNEDVPRQEEGLTCGVADVEGRQVLYVINDGRQYQLDSLYESETMLTDWYSYMQNDCFVKQFVLFGFGNGMYVRKIIQECKDKYEIFVIELSITIFKEALQSFDVTDIFSNSRVQLYIEGLSEEEWSDFLYDHVDFSSLQGLLWGKYMNYQVLFPTKEKQYFESIQLITNAILSSRHVQERYGRTYYTNIFSNYPKFLHSYSLLSLYRNLPKNIPAVIVAAGPSLGKNIQELKQMKGKCLMIAADSALPALLKENIIPDLYVSVDGQKNSAHFLDERIASIPSVVSLLTATSAIKEKQTHFFISEETLHLVNFMQQEQIVFPALSSGGSVANIGFSLAVLLEIHTIILVGQDLAYTGNKTHAENTVRANGTIDQRTLTIVKDIYGNPIQSSQEFLLYKTWFEEQIKGNQSLRVIDATEGGALIEGSIVQSLAKTIEEECRMEVDIAQCIAKCEHLFTEEQQLRLKEYLKSIPDDLEQLIRNCKKSLANYEKMYLLAKQGKENSGEMKRLFAANNELGKLIDDNPVMSYVEYLIQNSVHSVLENAYKQKNDIRDEIIEASTIGKEYTENLLKQAEWMKKDIVARLEQY